MLFLVSTDVDCCFHLQYPYKKDKIGTRVLEVVIPTESIFCAIDES